MMNINDILKLKFPTLDFTKDIILQDDGDGVYIKEWNVANIKLPDAKTLLQWEQEIYAIYKQNIIESKLKDLIASKPLERGYDSILTLMSYTNSSNIQWKAEADAFISWRDALFAYTYQTLSDVQLGNIPEPTIEEFLAGCPLLTWP